MSYHNIPMRRPEHYAVVLICDQCGKVIDAIGVTGEVISIGLSHACSEKCAAPIRKREAQAVK